MCVYVCLIIPFNIQTRYVYYSDINYTKSELIAKVKHYPKYKQFKMNNEIFCYMHTTRNVRHIAQVWDRMCYVYI